MTFRVNAFPDMTRSDAVVAVFDTWHTGGREQQQATLDAITSAWDGGAWPATRLISRSAFSSLDGESVLIYSPALC